MPWVTNSTLHFRLLSCILWALLNPSLDCMATEAFVLTSPAFREGENLPVTYTCMGNGDAPPLRWENPPKGTESFALTIVDLDTPFGIGDSRNESYYHWGIYNIPSGIEHLAEPAEEHLPNNVIATVNDADTEDFRPPCSPTGPHRYRMALYALNRVLPDRAFKTTESMDATLSSPSGKRHYGVLGMTTLTAILKE